MTEEAVAFDVAPSEIELDGVGVEDELDKAKVNIVGVEGEFTAAEVNGTLIDEGVVKGQSGEQHLRRINTLLHRLTDGHAPHRHTSFSFASAV